MGIVAPPTKSGDKNKEVKVNKSFLSDALRSRMRQLTNGENGVVTVAQAMADRLIQIATYAESNTDAVAAQKLIYERVEGKAAVIKADESKPMPRVVFSLTQDDLDKVNDAASAVIEDLENENDGEGLIIATMDNKTFVG